MEREGQPVCPACLLQQGMRSSTAMDGLQSWSPPPIERLKDAFSSLEFERLLGQGGMGAVYKVRQTELERPAALKVLPEIVSDDAGFKERFLREARLLASLSHPHIVTVYEFGQRDGIYFLLMEYVDGVTLRQASLADPIKRLAPKEALAVVGQLCDALQFAHEEGVVHRDIKPENILIDKRGRVKIADFGLAKLLGKPADLPTLTRTHQLLGTPAYMAPEQVEGQPLIDHRADIYSVGVVFYELLTGELPLGRFQPPSAKAQLDARLDEVVLRTLEKEPERRYQHASEVRTDVNRITEAQHRGSVRSKRAPVFWGLVGVAVGLAIAVGLSYWGITTERFDVWRPFSVQADLRPAEPDGYDMGTTDYQTESMADAQFADATTDEDASGTDDMDAGMSGMSEYADMEAMGPGGFGEMGGLDSGSEMGGFGSGSEEMAGGMGGGYVGEGMGGGYGGMESGYNGEGTGGGYGGEELRGGYGAEALQPVLTIDDRKVKLRKGFADLPDDRKVAVETVLTKFHEEYVALEGRHSIRRKFPSGGLETTVLAFPDKWRALENRFWEELDGELTVSQQRAFRGLRFAAALDETNPGYPAALSSHVPTYPGLLGWDQSGGINVGEQMITIRLGRKGTWHVWALSSPGNIIEYPSEPQLPSELNRFQFIPTPMLAFENAQAVWAASGYGQVRNTATDEWLSHFLTLQAQQLIGGVLDTDQPTEDRAIPELQFRRALDAAQSRLRQQIGGERLNRAMQVDSGFPQSPYSMERLLVELASSTPRVRDGARGMLTEDRNSDRLLVVFATLAEIARSQSSDFGVYTHTSARLLNMDHGADQTVDAQWQAANELERRIKIRQQNGFWQFHSSPQVPAEAQPLSVEPVENPTLASPSSPIGLDGTPEVPVPPSNETTADPRSAAYPTQPTPADQTQDDATTDPAAASDDGSDAVTE